MVIKNTLKSFIQNTVYIVNGQVKHICYELLDIYGSIVYTNYYKEYTTRIINTWEDITIRFMDDNGHCGDWPNSSLHYIDHKFYILAEDKLIRVLPPKSGFIWETFSTTQVDTIFDIIVDKKAIEKAKL